MSTISGIGFAPRAIMNQPHKNTINNNYKNDLNTDSYTPMSFKGGTLTMSKEVAALKNRVMISSDDKLASMLNFFFRESFPIYEEQLRKAKCFKDIEIEINKYDFDSGFFTLLIKRGEKVLETNDNEAIIDNIGDVLGQLIVKATNTYSPKGGKINRTNGPLSKISEAWTKHVDSTADNTQKKAKRNALNEIDKAESKFREAECSSEYAINIGKINGNGTPVTLTRASQEIEKSTPDLLDFVKTLSQYIKRAVNHSEEIDEFGPPIKKVAENIEENVE